MNKPLEQAFKAIELNIGISAATANKIIIRGTLVSKPSNRDSLLAPVCANGVAIRDIANNRRDSGSKIKVIHNLKMLLHIQKKLRETPPADSMS
jgi:hypothetical protein